MQLGILLQCLCVPLVFVNMPTKIKVVPAVCGTALEMPADVELAFFCASRCCTSALKLN